LLSSDQKPSYNKWLAVVVVLLLASTIVLAVFFAIKQGNNDTPSIVFHLFFLKTLI
jgi:hypothetical protein